MSQSLQDEICGLCIHHRKDDGCWVCNNPESECYGCYTEYSESCVEFEERQPKNNLEIIVKKK